MLIVAAFFALLAVVLGVGACIGIRIYDNERQRR